MRSVQWIIASLLLLVASPSYATIYWVNSSHSGSSDGTNGNPWQTIGEVNQEAMGPGDVVRFMRGEIFRGTIYARSGVTYEAYGSGPKPKIFRSFKGSQWTNSSGNLWTINVQENLDVGNIIFDWGINGVGRKVESLAKVNSQDKFYSNPSTGLVTMYSTNDPATRYGDIELAIAESIISVWAVDNVVIQNLELRNGGVHGIYAGGGCSNLQVYNTDFIYIGGAYHPTATPLVRYGNGVEFWSHVSGAAVADCFFTEIFDVAMTCQGAASNADIHNVYFYDNTVVNCEQSFEFWIRDGWGALAYNIYFQDNDCFHAGGGWSHDQHPFPNGTHVLIWQSDTQSYVDNIVIRNNLFYGWKDSVVFTGDKEYLKLASVHNSSKARILLPISGSEKNVWWRPEGGDSWKFFLRYATTWVGGIPNTAFYADWKFVNEFPLTQN